MRLLAEATVFVATSPETANQVFNVSNGDVYRWSEVSDLLFAPSRAGACAARAACGMSCWCTPGVEQHLVQPAGVCCMHVSKTLHAEQSCGRTAARVCVVVHCIPPVAKLD